MPDHTSSSSAASRRDSTTTARNHPSKLKSWFTNLYSRGLSHHDPHPQIHSPLLSALPLEIRRQIYALVLHSYGSVQHICIFNGKLIHMRCASLTPHRYFQTYSARDGVCRTWDNAYRESVQNGWEIVPLLLSCRQTYLEFIEIIYSSTAFHLYINGATRFIATVPAPYLALAHLHLSFDIDSPMYLPYRLWPNGYTAENTNPKTVKAVETEWEAFWRAFIHVRVRVLIVEILDHGVRVPEQVLLEPLRQVSEMKEGRFEVVLPWPEGLKRSGEFGNAGFVVRRPPEGVDLMMRFDRDYACLALPQGRPIWQRLRRR